MVKAASTSSVPTLSGGPQGPVPHHLLGRSPLYHLQPSPPPASHALPGSPLLQHKQRGLLPSHAAATVDAAAGGGGAAACVSCKRVATSTLQLAKFKRCQLCGLSSCAICARVCGGRPWASSSGGSAAGRGGGGGHSNSNGRRKGRLAAADGDEDEDEDGMEDRDTVDGSADALRGDAQIGTPTRECGRIVCRECSVESSAGIPHCYQCTFPPELQDDGMASAVPEAVAVTLESRSYSEGDDNGISIEDYDFAV